jgi:PAS domain S-box-containing protein
VRRIFARILIEALHRAYAWEAIADSTDIAREAIVPVLLGDGAECAEIGISIYADDGTFVAVNERACRILGYPREELVTHDVGDFTDGNIDRTVLTSQHRREGVRVVHRKDGTTAPVAYVVVPTRVASIGFFMAFFWELADDDPRAAQAK